MGKNQGWGKPSFILTFLKTLGPNLLLQDYETWGLMREAEIKVVYRSNPPAELSGHMDIFLLNFSIKWTKLIENNTDIEVYKKALKFKLCYS